MQITPDTGQLIADNLGWPPNYTSDDLYRPMVSIGLGATYLEQQRIRFNGDLFTALAAYNAGPEAASIWSDLSGPDSDLFLEVIRISQTSDYIRSIYEIYSMYRIPVWDNPLSPKNILPQAIALRENVLTDMFHNFFMKNCRIHIGHRNKLIASACPGYDIQTRDRHIQYFRQKFKQGFVGLSLHRRCGQMYFNRPVTQDFHNFVLAGTRRHT